MSIPPSENDADQPFLSRREFATTGAAFVLASLLSGCAESAHNLTGASPKAAARLLSTDEVELPNGGIQRTTVTAWDGLPPLGVGTTATCIETRTPTATGEVIEYEMKMTPRLVMASPGRSVGTMKIRYEFTHGAVQGDTRVDTVVMSSVIDGVATTPRTRRAVRPVNEANEFTAMTPRDRLARAVDLLNQHGHIPKDFPGAWRILDDGSPAKASGGA